MATNSSKLTVGTGRAGHGDLRGADAARSPQFEGSFGRMFRALPPANFDEDDLARLAEVNQMLSPPEVVQDANGNNIRDDKGFLIPKATPEDQVDDDLWRKSSELVSVLRKPVAVPLNLLHIAKTSIMAAMKQGDFVTRIAQIP